jgi:adenylate cyclase
MDAMNFIKKYGKHLVSPFTLGLVVTAIITYIAILYYAERHLASKNDRSVASFIQQIHEKTIDWRLTDRGPAYGSDRVAILAIDEESIDQEGRWPWPRDKTAKLTERALGLGAKIVAFDIIFSEEDSNSTVPTLTKIKRQLRDQAQLPETVAGLIDAELAQGNLDQKFGDMVKANADRLVMGAFFDAVDRNPAFVDFCNDARFRRGAESQYWKSEARPLLVKDPALEQIRFPHPLTENLETYFTMLEVAAANTWFQRFPEMSKKIIYSLDDWAIGIPPEAVPGLAVYWLNNDLAMGKTLMEQVNPNLASLEGTRSFYNRFGAAFTKQERANLDLEVSGASRDYCSQRFFRDEDELNDIKKFQAKWGAGAEASAEFKDFSWPSLWAKLPPEERATPSETFAQAMDRIIIKTTPNAILQIGNWTVNIPVIADVTKHSGYFNAVQDTDGSIRRSLLFARRGSHYAPSLALKTFLLDRGFSAQVSLSEEELGGRSDRARIVSRVEVLDANGKPVMTVPVDYQGNLMINYSGGVSMFPHISAAEILTDADTLTVQQAVFQSPSNRMAVEKKTVKKTEFLKDKILIAGATAIGVYDLRVTPFEENYPGVETHANTLSNLLVSLARETGEKVDPKAPGFLRTHAQEAQWMCIGLVVMGLLLSGLIATLASVAGLLCTLAFLVAMYVVDKFVLFQHGIVVTMLFPFALISAIFIVLTFYKYFTEEKTKRELKGTFEKYVSPSIVAEVLADPSNIELGGKKVEMTVMFSDVRGFTTISEKLDPRELSNLLNSYLTPMTDLVFKNKGTLDKYMGDAIMAFWGAPIQFADHAHHACRCALAMLVKLKELQADYRAKGLPEIDIGIGLNTGDMSVGNMGSDTVRSYTVMGDAVNLGSRLEGINKQYGTRIIISEFTRDAIKDGFVTREIDWVKVKGKNEPVRIFELIAEVGGASHGIGREMSRDVTEALPHFNLGFALYHQRNFAEAAVAFNEALKAKPDDTCSQLYIERCEDYLKEPPEPDWDGVFTMKTK